MIVARFSNGRDIQKGDLIAKRGGRWVFVTRNPHLLRLWRMERDHFASNGAEMAGAEAEIAWTTQSHPTPVECGLCGENEGWYHPSIATRKCANCGALEYMGEWELVP